LTKIQKQHAVCMGQRRVMLCEVYLRENINDAV
jgi:hypothetical protein